MRHHFVYLELGRMCVLDDSSEAVQHPRGDAALHLQSVLDSLALHTVTCPQHLHQQHHLHQPTASGRELDMTAQLVGALGRKWLVLQ